MTRLIFTNIFIEHAKEILSLAYQFDKTATYSNDFLVHGNQLTATISENEKASNESSVKKFDVTIESDIYQPSTLKEYFNAYDFAL